MFEITKPTRIQLNGESYLLQEGDKVDILNNRILYEGVGETIQKAIQGVLDVVGFVPVVGEVADFVNLLWRGYQQDWLGVAASAISMSPEPASDAVSKLVYYGAKAADMVGPDNARTLLNRFPIDEALESLRGSLESLRGEMEVSGEELEEEWDRTLMQMSVCGVISEDTMSFLEKQGKSMIVSAIDSILENWDEMVEVVNGKIEEILGDGHI